MKGGFKAFIEDVGRRPKRKNMTLDRKDNNGIYEPDNVAWVTRKQNQNNTRSNITMTYNGKTQTLSQWSEEIGLDRDMLYWRHKLGWSDEKALTVTPYGRK